MSGTWVANIAMTDIRRFPNKDALSKAVAEHFVKLAERGTRSHGRFAVALAGGSTPEGAYRLLATTYKTKVKWQQVHVFWGDERTVPPDHQDSNYRMALDAFLSAVPIPAGQIYRMRGELDPEEAAEDYNTRLQKFFGGVGPRFDLVILGMGDDGHTASLFPHTSALEEHEAWVVANHVPQQQTTRITLTVPAINAAAEVLFMVAGEAKADALQAVLRGERQPAVYPAQLIAPSDGTLLWMVDQAAAAEI